MVTDKLREAECGLAGQLKPRVATLREAPTFSRIDPDAVNFDHLAEVVVSGFSTVVTPPSYSLERSYYTNPHSRAGGLCSISLREKYLHKLL